MEESCMVELYLWKYFMLCFCGNISSSCLLSYCHIVEVSVLYMNWCNSQTWVFVGAAILKVLLLYIMDWFLIKVNMEAISHFQKKKSDVNYGFLAYIWTWLILCNLDCFQKNDLTNSTEIELLGFRSWRNKLSWDRKREGERERERNSTEINPDRSKSNQTWRDWLEHARDILILILRESNKWSDCVEFRTKLVPR